MKGNSWKGENAVFFTDIVWLAHVSEGFEGAFIEVAGILKYDGIEKNEPFEMPPFFNYVHNDLFFIVGKFQSRHHVSVDHVIDVGTEDS